jgi:hypothetical protein
MKHGKALLPIGKQALYAVKVMEISIETEDAVNPKVLKMGGQCHHLI